MNIAETIIRSSYFQAKEKEEYIKALQTKRRIYTASLFKPNSKTCPMCKTHLQIRVVEHPNRELGFEGQTLMRCPSCLAHRVWPYTLDQGTTFAAIMRPDGSLERVTQIPTPQTPVEGSESPSDARSPLPLPQTLPELNSP